MIPNIKIFFYFLVAIVIITSIYIQQSGIQQTIILSAKISNLAKDIEGLMQDVTVLKESQARSSLNLKNQIIKIKKDDPFYGIVTTNLKGDIEDITPSFSVLSGIKEITHIKQLMSSNLWERHKILIPEAIKKGGIELF